MECRVCHQSITFVRGSYPGRKRVSTRAVHDSEMTKAVEQAHGEVVNPHPGVQRKLRLELEHNHPNAQSAPEETQTMGVAEKDSEQSENTRAYSNASA